MQDSANQLNIPNPLGFLDGIDDLLAFIVALSLIYCFGSALMVSFGSFDTRFKKVIWASVTFLVFGLVVWAIKRKALEENDNNGKNEEEEENEEDDDED